MIVKINDKDINLKYTFRATMLFENITGKSFTASTTTDILIYFYCTIIASDKNLIFPFEDFLDLVDSEPMLMVEFADFLTQELNKTRTLSPEEDENPLDEEKKNLSQKKKREIKES